MVVGAFANIFAGATSPSLLVAPALSCPRARTRRSLVEIRHVFALATRNFARRASNPMRISKEMHCTQKRFRRRVRSIEDGTAKLVDMDVVRCSVRTRLAPRGKQLGIGSS